jgi:predicted transcriptional regulator
MPLRNSRVTVNLTPEVHAELRRLAGEQARSVSNLCQTIIEASLERRNR